MDSHAALRKNADEFARYYARLAKVNMAPLWEVLKNLVTEEPVTPVKPAQWRYRLTGQGRRALDVRRRVGRRTAHRVRS